VKFCTPTTLDIWPQMDQLPCRAWPGPVPGLLFHRIVLLVLVIQAYRLFMLMYRLLIFGSLRQVLLRLCLRIICLWTSMLTYSCLFQQRNSLWILLAQDTLEFLAPLLLLYIQVSLHRRTRISDRRAVTVGTNRLNRRARICVTARICVSSYLVILIGHLLRKSCFGSTLARI